MLFSVLVSFYLSVLLVFAMVTNPVVYCFLLLLSAAIGGLLAYSLLGFSWYLALFYIVYVGGIYVLYIFVSVQSPNAGGYTGLGLSIVFFAFVFFLWLSLWEWFGGGLADQSLFLVSFWERLGYCYFCAALIVGFFLVSLVGANKSSFHR